MNNNLPLVSVISPTYNHEKYMADCIESVIAQTYENWEMIIIDDGSTDSSYSIACDYARKDKRIKPFTQQNVGIFRLGESYNFALGQSSGKYIAILECDDVWLPRKLEIQVGVLENNPECVLSWGKAFKSSVDLSNYHYIAPTNEEDKPLFFNKPAGSFLKPFIYRTIVPAMTILIRRDALIAIGGFLQGFNLPLVDIPTTLELLMKGEFAFIDEPLGHWRISPSQVTKTYTAEMISGHYSMIQSVMQRFPQIFETAGLTKPEIDLHFKKRLVKGYSSSGRYKLIRKDFKGARKDYLRSIFYYGFLEPIWKIRSMVGYFFSLFRMDIEWLAKLIGNPTYK
ncbi:MAG TPA: glycosyltransferase family 2 protein [Prolixibacteraceae bacterium]